MKALLMLRLVVITFAFLFMQVTGVWAKSDILVFAAASMKNVLEVIGAEFENECDCKIVFSFAGSGTLARQIEAGAPADIYISADQKWMDWLNGKAAILAETQRIIAGNRLIVAVGLSRDTNAGENLNALFGRERVAMANPMSVPAGRYGKQALEASGLWDKLSGQLVFGENVRVSLALVARGDVSSAIVYRSDLQVEPRVKSVYLFAEDEHASIVYPAALVRASLRGEEFMRFVQTKSVQDIFLNFGFTAPDND